MARYLTMLAAMLLAGSLSGCDRSLKVVHPPGLPAGAIIPCGRVSHGSPLKFIAGGKYLVAGENFAPYAVDVDRGAAAPGPSGRGALMSRPPQSRRLLGRIKP